MKQFLDIKVLSRRSFSAGALGILNPAQVEQLQRLHALAEEEEEAGDGNSSGMYDSSDSEASDLEA